MHLAIIERRTTKKNFEIWEELRWKKSEFLLNLYNSGP